MQNPNNMPGAGSITDTMEFMRKMWGTMGGPAMGIPSLSVEEINKKITDLKAVASWLELNMNMLRATIQTLEVQSATLSTLQAMGAILTPREGATAATAATAAASPFGFPAWPPQSRNEVRAPKAAAAVQPEPEEDVEEDVEEDREPAAPADGRASPSAGARSESAAPQQPG